ncbi:hypothetical protein [Candidatus Viridilinea mediisalina]|uniref:Uncharacterized protein n=1 Tax=Candidatus Viridilinea mediisalina TaxID=2024553 RepID=A0A2A6RNY3_9CHLR|nr:hypothetical protein [Candidatus Viridilinea mediisalina]PDW04772.1 hypothetical protein CJ255_01640 [Candidatus Viridilinea mediisalina]
MTTPTSTEEQQWQAATAALLRIIFPHDALVWIIAEEYGSDGPVWRTTLVCQGEWRQWMRRRYRYDIPSGTLHFAGEEPISGAELRSVRQQGRRL